jgi:hypothetical protein
VTLLDPHRDRSGTPTATIPNTGNHPERPARRRPYVNLYLQRVRQEVLMVVDFTVVRDPAARGWDHDLLDRPLRLEVLSLLTCRTEP